MKKVFSVFLILGMLASILALPASAASLDNAQTADDVAPYTYSAVQGYISNADVDIELNLNGVMVRYFYGDGYTVYEKCGEYYLVHYSDDYSDVSINGTPMEVEAVRIPRNIQLPQAIQNMPGLYAASAAWTYLFTDLITVSVGGLLVDRAMALIPVSNLSTFIISQIASYLAEQAVNNILPTNFAVTIRDDWYYANLDPWMGTVDYSHDYSAWAGTANQPLQRHIAGDYYTGSIVYRFT